jgi:Holliday junction resolvase RusA-like endonuclease
MQQIADDERGGHRLLRKEDGMNTVPSRVIPVEHRAIPREPVIVRLPYPPSVNNLFCNIPGGGRAVTERYKMWREMAARAVSPARARISGPVEIAMTFEKKPGRHDLDNLPKAVLDLLSYHRVIDDDDAKTLKKLTLQWGAVSGVEVEIVPLPMAPP